MKPQWGPGEITNEKGLWKKGGPSPNPLGRRKKLESLKVKCYALTDEVLKELVRILRTSDLDSNRINAGKLILAYGHGLPQAKITIEDESERPTVFLTKEKLLAIASGTPLPSITVLPKVEEPAPDSGNNQH
jgi:hypothetical protein